MFPASVATVDAASGVLSTIQTTLLSGVLPVCVVGSTVASHGSGAHSNAVMPVGSLALRVAGMGVIFQTCVATCTHVATGSSPLRVGG